MHEGLVLVVVKLCGSAPRSWVYLPPGFLADSQCVGTCPELPCPSKRIFLQQNFFFLSGSLSQPLQLVISVVVLSEIASGHCEAQPLIDVLLLPSNVAACLGNFF